jgi:hypothetical protein
MYSGTTFAHNSGNLVGVHQKIDRIARGHLKRHVRPGRFPTMHQILHFEGNNGPDSIKRKSPSKDEPWHYIDPSNPDDKGLITLINDHVANLTDALRAENNERAAFEAAWLAHAVVDGLTPAHHYPLNDKIEELWGKPHHERTTIKDKNIIKGDTRRDSLSKNWQYWGVGGIFTAHLAYELGVASIIAPYSFKDAGPSEDDITGVEQKGFEAVFYDTMHAIADMKLYDEFEQKGWTRTYGIKTRKQLIPLIIKTVCLGWYWAAFNAEVTHT